MTRAGKCSSNTYGQASCYTNDERYILLKLKERVLHTQSLCLITCTHPLLEGGLIVLNTFEPQSVNDSGIQPSHHRHRHGYQA